MTVVTTRGVLLRSHPYSETSRVLRFLTEDYGVVGVMGRGVRKGRSGRGLDLFAESTVTLHVKEGRDLQTLREQDPGRPRRGLGADPLRLAAAGVVAELVLRHHGEAESHEVYRVVSDALDDLARVPRDGVVPALLGHTWRLVAALGFQPVVDVCVQCGGTLESDAMARFDFEAGGVRCPGCQGGMVGPRVGPGARIQLERLAAGEVPADLVRPRAHLQLLSDFITHHVSLSRPLDSFRVLSALLGPDEAPGESGVEGSDA